jgi:hypothetical protein
MLFGEARAVTGSGANEATDSIPSLFCPADLLDCCVKVLRISTLCTLIAPGA